MWVVIISKACFKRRATAVRAKLARLRSTAARH